MQMDQVNSPDQSPDSPLSAREQELLEFLATGATNQQIALELHISVNTVKAHLRNIFDKLDVQSRTEAALYAVQHGLISAGFGPVDAQDSQAGQVDVPEPESRGQRLRRMLLRPGVLAAAGLMVVLVMALVFWPRPVAQSFESVSDFVDMPSAFEEEAVDPSHPRWRPRAQMPTPRGRFALAQVGELTYAISGLSVEGLTDRVEAYDAAEDTWQRRAPKPVAAANIGATVVDGLVYVPGGFVPGPQGGPDRVLDLLEIYDPDHGRWSAGPTLPVPLCSYAIAPAEGGFFLFGGSSDGQTYVSSVYHYTIDEAEWRVVAQMDRPRGHVAATTVDGTIYLSGGSDGSSDHDQLRSFSPELALKGEDPWRTLPSMGAVRAGHAMIEHDGDLYVVGGSSGSPQVGNERYDLSLETWSSFPSPVDRKWVGLGLSSVDYGGEAFLIAFGGWSGHYLGVQAFQTRFRVFLPAQGS